MKNFIIITLGTSDVQVKLDLIEGSDFEIDGFVLRHKHKKVPPINLAPNRDRNDTRLLSQCRVDGEIIMKAGIDTYLPVFDFPLTLPAIETIINKSPEHKIHKWLFVYTNQEDPKHRVRDTLYVRQILSRKIELAFGASSADFIDFAVTEKVPDIDHQYIQFALKCRQFLETPENEVRQVILLAQGGIDQINQALTLQLTQAFKHKLRLYQKAEDQHPTHLEFPRLFLNDLNKQKINKHLDDYDFGAIDKNLSSNKLVYHLAQYSSKRLNLQYDSVKVNTDIIEKGTLSKLNNSQLSINDTSEYRLKDLYIATKIHYHQKKYSDFLWRLFTLGENLFKVQIEAVVGSVDHYRLTYKQLKDANGINVAWEQCLNKLDATLLSELKQTKNYKKQSIHVDNPNRWAFQALYKMLVDRHYIDHTQEEVNRYTTVGNAVEELASSRNDIAHKLGSVSLAEINRTLIDFKLGYSSQSLLADLDQIFNITNFGIYDTIRDEIRELL